MTQNPCNCETCSKAKLTRGVNFLNAGVLCEGKEVLPDGVATINKKGCFSHPQAREYLMRDVIDTLESKYCMADGYLASKAYADAIALIKRGARK